VSLAPRRSKNGIEMILQASSISMEELTNLLGYANVIGVNHIVVDMAGLTGRYSFTLTFAPSQEVRPAGMPTPPAALPTLRPEFGKTASMRVNECIAQSYRLRPKLASRQSSAPSSYPGCLPFSVYMTGLRPMAQSHPLLVSSNSCTSVNPAA
jgi:hypothetical protein